jgi:hypothetical protein
MHKISESGEVDEEWKLGNMHNGEFCCYYTALWQCKCDKEKKDKKNTPNLLMRESEEPCDACAPFIKSNIESPQFLGIRKDLHNLLGVTMTETLLNVLHTCMVLEWWLVGDVVKDDSGCRMGIDGNTFKVSK